jgi:hypothetical protein
VFVTAVGICLHADNGKFSTQGEALTSVSQNDMYMCILLVCFPVRHVQCQCDKDNMNQTGNV